MPPPAPEVRRPFERRLHADRRRGADRRWGPRRTVRHPALEDRRRVVERRCRERRATIERRRWVGRRRHDESAGEHVRNAFQLLVHLASATTLDPDGRRDLDAAMDRLMRAVRELERGV